jgi:hypothetical protein
MVCCNLKQSFRKRRSQAGAWERGANAPVRFYRTGLFVALRDGKECAAMFKEDWIESGWVWIVAAACLCFLAIVAVWFAMQQSEVLWDGYQDKH